MAEPLKRFNTRVGIAKETTFGDGTAATDVIPVSDFKENNTADVIRDNGLRGIPSRDFLSQQGVTHSELTMSGLAYPDQVDWALMSIFGADTKTGSSVPYAHAFAMAAVPPSYCIEGQQATGSNLTLKYAGFKASKVGFTFEANSGALAVSLEGSSYAGVLMTGTNPSLPTYSVPFEGWRGTIVSGSGSLANRLISAEINIMREIQVIHTSRASQAPWIIAQGPIAIEGTVTLTVADYADYSLWLAHTTTSLVISFTYGSSTTLRSIVFTITQANLGNGPVEIDRSGVGLTIKLSFLGIYNATDVGPAAVVVNNTLAAAS